jgi:DnaK suppressor protein
MNTEHFKKLLLAKRRELQSTLRTLEGEASTTGESEVRDLTDDATVSQGVSDSLETATLLSQTLEEVQDALRRIEDGSYGKCTVCGREIEAARLEAVPWTPYCLQDQEKLDGKTVQSATL